MECKILKIEEKDKGLFKVTIQGARLSFPQLFEAKPNKKYPNSPPRFTSLLLLNKRVFAKLEDICTKTVRENINEDAESYKEIDSRNRKLKSWQDEHTGERQYGLNTSNTPEYPPKYINAQGKVELDPLSVDADKKLYAGCYVNVVLTIQALVTPHAETIFSNISGIQFAEHGEKLANGGLSEEEVVSEFGTVETDDLSDMDSDFDDDDFEDDDLF